MNILAIDTSSQAASCAYMEGDKLVGEFFNNARITHSQTILPMVSDMMESCRRSIEDTDVFAISIGPGSYTGLRIGLSAIKGFTFVNQKPCAAISTLLGLSYNMLFHEGVIVPVMDARRNRVYTGVFSSDTENISRLQQDQVLEIEALGDLLKSLGATDAVLVGDAAHICKEKLSDTLPHLVVAPETLLHQRAGSLCLAAKDFIEKDRLVAADTLEPEYLILPEAQRNLEAENNNK